MKHLITFSLVVLLAMATRAQTPASAARSSGKITYEGMRAVGGQDTRPGGSDAPESAPNVISFTQKLVFSGTMAKEERDRPQGMTRRDGGGGNGAAPGQNQPRDGQQRNGRVGSPMEQTTFLDLANRLSIDVLTIKSDSASQTYRAERPLPKLTGWQLSDKTKKVAGYVCHKATVTGRIPRRSGRRPGDAPGAGSEPAPEETYTIWYTTDLPFTYSPVALLTPEKGVVLQIESDSESFKATNVSLEAVAETAVQPPKEAKTVLPDEMNQLRRKVMADFRQRSAGNGGFPGRN